MERERMWVRGVLQHLLKQLKDIYWKVTKICKEKCLHCEASVINDVFCYCCYFHLFLFSLLTKPRKSKIYLRHFKCFSIAGDKYDRARWCTSTAQLSGIFNVVSHILKHCFAYLFIWCIGITIINDLHLMIFKDGWFHLGLGFMKLWRLLHIL